MKTVVAGGTIVTSSGRRRADVVCDDGRVVEVVEPRRWSMAECDVIDAAGHHVLPGLIDPHVHSRDPGMTNKEDFAHATRAAAAGGITTILEMPNAIPAVIDPDVLRDRALAHAVTAHVDFGLWGLALGRDSAPLLPDLRDAGAVAMKVFWGFYFDRGSGQLIYSERDGRSRAAAPPASTGEMWELLAAAAACGITVGVHCEDRTILDAAARRHSRPEDYEALLQSRPDVAESAAVAALIELVRDTGAHGHVLHVSSARSADLIRRARADGLPVSGETCPHYLTLTADDYSTIGPAMKIFPPVRRKSDQEALWAALLDGTIASIGSDHAPHSAAERSQAFADQPAGAVGVETMVPVMLDQVSRGRISLPRLVEVLSEATAKTFGLYPRKGAIIPGADADFTIVDLQRRWTIRNERLHSKTKLSPWHGRSGLGAPVTVVLRGRVVARDGEPVGKPSGTFIRARQLDLVAAQAVKQR